MSSFTPRPFEFYSFPEFLQLQFDEPEKRVIWRYQSENRYLNIRSHALNIISKNNIRNNVRTGLRIAMDLAEVSTAYKHGWKGFNRLSTKASEPDDHRVLYVNTYAAPKELRKNMKYMVDLNLKQTGKELGMEAITKEEAPVRNEFGSQPLKLINSPMGAWEENSQKITGLLKLNAVNVIIINSFEYAPITARQKVKMAQEIIEWQQRYDVTIIVLTTENRKALHAGIASRGPIGMLSGHAETVWKFSETEEELRSLPGALEDIPDIEINLQKLLNQPRIADVHEKSFHTQEDQARRKIKGEGGILGFKNNPGEGIH